MLRVLCREWKTAGGGRQNKGGTIRDPPAPGFSFLAQCSSVSAYSCDWFKPASDNKVHNSLLVFTQNVLCAHRGIKLWSVWCKGNIHTFNLFGFIGNFQASRFESGHGCFFALHLGFLKLELWLTSAKSVEFFFFLYLEIFAMDPWCMFVQRCIRWTVSNDLIKICYIWDTQALLTMKGKNIMQPLQNSLLW